MALPDSYTVKPGSIPAYFDAMLNAEAPDRFSQKFLESLEFKSTNDRLFIGILKELGFLDADGVPKQRYYEFLDRSRSAKIVAEGIREAYSDLFAVNKQAQSLSREDVKNKLRTLYQGTKKENIIERIAATFSALCDYADFEGVPVDFQKKEEEKDDKTDERKKKSEEETQRQGTPPSGAVSLDSLQYHINIVLPDSRDQAVYDAIFKSLRDHLGPKQ
jgi:hypothetical protein